MIYKYTKCHRGLDSCESMDCIAVPPEDVTEEQLETLDFKPVSFVCCGIQKKIDEEIPQDCFTFCFVNAATDEMTHNDEQDLTHMIKVISTTLAVTATRRINSGTIDVPTINNLKDEDFSYDCKYCTASFDTVNDVDQHFKDEHSK